MNTPYQNNGHAPKYRSLSLCVIYGNEAAHIERFIDSFKLIADEMVFVRAIGNQEPDGTKERIEEKMIAEGLNIILGEYKNAEILDAPGNWPHVDRFDKARQLSFDLATGDLRMWADCDDVLPAESIAQIMHLKMSMHEDVFFAKYELHGMDHGLFRERIVGRIPMRWMSPVHECMVLPPDCKRIMHEGIVIEHRPICKPQSSVDRNLKILEYWGEHPLEDDWLPGMCFYLHRDFFMHPQARENGYLEKSMWYGLKALTFDALGTTEKYEVLMNLSTMLPEKPELILHVPHAELTGADVKDGFKSRERWLLNALRTDPSRREAVAALAALEIDRKAYPRALAYVHMMRGIPEPTSFSRAWTHRRAFYTWKGALLQTQCQRYCGNEAEARKLEDYVFDKNGRTFSVLHATRRGELAKNKMMLWLTLAEKAGAIEWIFAVDEDDMETREALKGYRTVVIPEGKGPVAAWNEAAKVSTGKILIQMSDDWFPPGAWDAMLYKHLGPKIDEQAVLKIGDGHRNDDLMCMAILTRKYYDSYGYIFDPAYFSMYSDNHFTLQAQTDGVIVDGSEIVFQHAHPLFDPNAYENGKLKENALDAVYKRSNDPKNYDSGLATFEAFKARKANYVGDIEF